MVDSAKTDSKSETKTNLKYYNISYNIQLLNGSYQQLYGEINLSVSEISLDLCSRILGFNFSTAIVLK